MARLVALNQDRRLEEANGRVRWLRPEYQAPKGAPALVKDEQAEFGLLAPPVAMLTNGKLRWPKALPERITSIRAVLAGQVEPLRPEEIARAFLWHKTRNEDVEDILTALVALGLAHRLEDNRYTP